MEAGEVMNILNKNNQLRNTYQITSTPCPLSLRERARVRELTSSYGSHASRGNTVGDAPASRTAERFRLHSHAKRRNDAKRQNVGWVEQSEAQQNQIVLLAYPQGIKERAGVMGDQSIKHCFTYPHPNLLPKQAEPVLTFTKASSERRRKFTLTSSGVTL